MLLQEPGPCGALDSLHETPGRANSSKCNSGTKQKGPGGAGGLPLQISTHLLCDLGQVAFPRGILATFSSVKCGHMSTLWGCFKDFIGSRLSWA